MHRQMTVVSQDRPGLLVEVTSLLAEAGIDIRDLDSQEVGGQQFLKLICSDYDRGLAVLTAVGFQVIAQETVLIRLEDRPGALAQVARQLAEESVAVRGISLIQQSEGVGLVAISSDNDRRVREIFADALIN
ncbi:ACT domain-containing protein [Motiliproteus sp. SC1-56]|uniref:ACT domain-containing protein n=1 Tax=Motiliproteus sp. SC1-56 TaxID=2799565 RepID=UPI001A901AE7|nr:ACT domain-containing protein [Motiliproteus sp. SC1-56]